MSNSKTSKPTSKSSDHSKVAQIPKPGTEEYRKMIRERKEKFLWAHDKYLNEREARRALQGKKPKRELPKCRRLGKERVVFEYKNLSISKDINAPRNRTERRAMQVSGIVPEGGFKPDAITEKQESDSETEALLKEMEMMCNPKIEKKMVENLEQKEKEKGKKSEKNVESTMKKIQNQKTSKSEDQKKNRKFEKSYYVLDELNEKSSYFVENLKKSEDVQKNSEGVKKFDEVLRMPKTPKKLIEKVPSEDIKNTSFPNQKLLADSDGVKKSHEILKVPKKLNKKDPEDVEAPGAPKPKTLKNPEDVKVPEGLQKTWIL